MIKGTLELSYHEIDRLEIIKSLESKKINQKAAAKALGLTTRQVRRLQERFRKEGVSGLISRRRGKASNNQLNANLKVESAILVREKYADFGPTLAHEKLTEEHEKRLSVESLRQIMIAENLWKPRQKTKEKRIFQLRPRRDQFGELIQIDGSPHDWFEGRGDPCTLIVFIDDATSKLTALHFSPTETTQAYMEVTKAHLTRYGRPAAMYSDCHAIFRINHPEAQSGNGLTQFGRAMNTLDIEAIHASTPQAKGRVERANKTLQDRLVKEMRLQKINNIEEANHFLPEFIEDYNRRFEKAAKNEKDAHRDVLHNEREVSLILSLHSKRKLSNNLELSYQKSIYQVQGNKHRLKQKQVTLCDLFGKEIVMLYEGKEIAYQVFNKGIAVPELVDEKTLNSRIDNALTQQKSSTFKPAADHPWRK